MNCPRTSNQDRAKWRTEWRKKLADHIRSRLDIAVLPAAVRLTTRAYRWNILAATTAALFKKQPSKHATGAYIDLCSGVGEHFEAVLAEGAVNRPSIDLQISKFKSSGERVIESTHPWLCKEVMASSAEAEKAWAPRNTEKEDNTLICLKNKGLPWKKVYLRQQKGPWFGSAPRSSKNQINSLASLMLLRQATQHSGVLQKLPGQSSSTFTLSPTLSTRCRTMSMHITAIGSPAVDVPVACDEDLKHLARRFD
ncbi:hypothetical protein V500_00688 [Pseudogymnoascus sp. VKM F-4518 (FW-2643)]|nr:hypothetical protein V500_00688 [Pseudogymnoascus sp. VKM F-4518 (FW-2643)]